MASYPAPEEAIDSSSQTPAPAQATAPTERATSAAPHPQSNEPETQTPPGPQHQVPSAYESLPSVAATAVAHHGLQVLQAASAASTIPQTATDLAQQYAQSAAIQMGDPQFSQSSDHQFSPSVATSITPVADISASAKVTRLRRACDMCSQRKVKCDESGPPCKPCSDLNVECTFRRAMKRRGPPNKHAEAAKAAKRARTEDANNLSPAPYNVAETLVSISSKNGAAQLDAESIAPFPVLQLLVDDFFIYIHPLIPFPHEPSFRHGFINRLDRTNSEFLALLASMIGILVASFPRSARSHLKAQHSTGLYPSATTMIEHCRNIALEARGARFMAKQDMNVDDAATSYFLGLAAAYTLQWRPCKRFMAETMTFCRELGTHRPRDTSTLTGNVPELAAELTTAANKPVDHVTDQIGKRIFWVMVAGVRSMTQLGASINELPLSPPTSLEPYPDQPIEVDDDYIYPHQILPQPEGTISLITGFNRNIRIYMTMNELVGVEMCYGINFFDWNAQKNILSNGLAAAKKAAEDMPAELQVKTEPGQTDIAGLDASGLHYCPPAFPNAQPPNDVRHALAEQPARRRQLQCEIQKANIHVSQLATRSYFVERYLNLRDAQKTQPNFGENGEPDVKDERDEMVANERELIVQNLLVVLASISQRNMEPNGQSLSNKIRQVASTLLQDAPERKGPVAMKSEQYLNTFLGILMKLEKIGSTVGGGTITQQDEEEELRSWASLRDYQLQFISNGGYLAEV
ncbi:hypothetical protein F4778DRAFT_59727 [Xylariomycetidae sp. FL2044]|nr:hypothetical protein F4778DRAFT_59727 [Xylariomycetidae sp. FL2044]